MKQKLQKKMPYIKLTQEVFEYKVKKVSSRKSHNFQQNKSKSESKNKISKSPIY